MAGSDKSRLLSAFISKGGIMKKFLTSLTCLVLVIIAGVSLVACGEPHPVRLASGDVSLSQQIFKNDKSLKLTKSKENEYVVSGTASTLDANQAKLWSSSYEGKAYVVVEIDLNAGAKAEYTGVLGDKKTSTNDTEEKDSLQIIRVVENNEKAFEIKVTEKSAKDSVTYKITFNLSNFKD